MNEGGGSGGRELLSAGGVVVCRGRQGVRVLVLHDSRYDEWRLPKGKLKLFVWLMKQLRNILLGMLKFYEN